MANASITIAKSGVWYTGTKGSVLSPTKNTENPMQVESWLIDILVDNNGSFPEETKKETIEDLPKDELMTILMQGLDD